MADSKSTLTGYDDEISAAFKAVGGGSSSQYATTQAVAGVAGAASATGIGAVPGAIATAAAALYDTFKGVLSGSFGVSPRPSWDATNKIANPTASQIVTLIINKVGASSVSDILQSYAAKLIPYIQTSAHSDPTTRAFYAGKVTEEALNMGGGFRLDAFPFDNGGDGIVQNQLAWAVWLHAMWLYGNVSQNEIPTGGALKKFQDSLEPTLNAAILETTGTAFDTGSGATGAGADVGSKVDTGKVVVKTSSVKATQASLFSNPIAIVLIVGVVVFFIYHFVSTKRA
jgi:hypothetical protein